MVAIGAAAVGAAISGGLIEWIGLQATLLATSGVSFLLLIPVLRDVYRR